MRPWRTTKDENACAAVSRLFSVEIETIPLAVELSGYVAQWCAEKI